MAGHVRVEVRTRTNRRSRSRRGRCGRRGRRRPGGSRRRTRGNHRRAAILPAATGRGPADAISARCRRASTGRAFASAIARRAFLACSLLALGGGGLGRRQQAEGQQCPEVLARPAGPFVVRTRAMGGLALGRRDHVTRRGMRVELPQRPGREHIRFGRAGLERVVRAADAEGETAQAVTDGGRGRADGARSICYSGHRSRAPTKLADPAPWVLTSTRGAIAFPAGTTRPD